MKKADIEEFYSRLQEQMPEPKGELHYVNPYTLLVAVVLSAQATDVGVNKATGPLFKVADTPEKNGCSARRKFAITSRPSVCLMRKPKRHRLEQTLD